MSNDNQDSRVQTPPRGKEVNLATTPSNNTVDYSKDRPTLNRPASPLIPISNKTEVIK